MPHLALILLLLLCPPGSYHTFYVCCCYFLNFYFWNDAGQKALMPYLVVTTRVHALLPFQRHVPWCIAGGASVIYNMFHPVLRCSSSSADGARVLSICQGYSHLSHIPHFILASGHQSSHFSSPSNYQIHFSLQISTSETKLCSVAELRLHYIKLFICFQIIQTSEYPARFQISTEKLSANIKLRRQQLRLWRRHGWILFCKSKILGEN